MRWTLPNILTVLRLLAAPGVAIMFLFFARPWADWYALALFLGAAATDFLDGYIARAWKQESRFGAMLDPIADKAMVIIALVVITGFSGRAFSDGLDPWILLPATMIIFREVFVSGLREFVGANAVQLKVTWLAKWKTTLQMVAIGVLFSSGAFEHYYGMQVFGMDREMVMSIFEGSVPDELGVIWKFNGMIWSWWCGVVLLWVAALLTLITGWDYLQKSMPHLKDGA